MLLLFDFADFRLNNLLHIFALISLASAKFPNGTRYRFVNCELVAMQTIKDFSSKVTRSPTHALFSDHDECVETEYFKYS